MTLLTAVGIDAEGQGALLAFALVRSQTIEWWNWFPAVVAESIRILMTRAPLLCPAETESSRMLSLSCPGCSSSLLLSTYSDERPVTLRPEGKARLREDGKSQTKERLQNRENRA